VIPARKRWGQHFLAAPDTAQRIVDAARLNPGDTVIEVGPGEGALTRPIAARGARLLAIEIDPLRVEALAREFAGNARVAILQGDVLEKSFGEWLAEAGCEGRAVLLGNLPYNVATPILSRAIEEPEAISRSIATVQREVARRFAARPGDEEYGYLSVRAAAFARARLLFDLAPSAFRPRPRVVSSLLELLPRSPSLEPALRQRALALASLGFRSRRKTLANALASAGRRAAWEEALAKVGKGPKARAEELSLEEYLELARRVPPGAAGKVP
jgi:16S rRNA (adenine1518-N6/adenine1519-N6)-dimethyltransferase